MQNNPMNNTIDCIFDINGTHIVLIKRGKDPYKGYWALPGGRQGIYEKLEETVVREVLEETGIGMKLLKDEWPYPINVLGEDTHLDQVRTYHSGSDPRGGNSTVHAVQLHGDPDDIAKKLKNGDDAADIGIFKLDDLPELAFDHFHFIEDYFVRLKRYKNPIPAVDVIIQYKGGIVYVERGGAVKGKALPGGFAKYGKTLEQSAIEEAKEETGLDIRIKGLLGVYSDPGRDPRKHVFSTVYIAEGNGTLCFGDDAVGGGIFHLDDVPRLKFDHNKMIDDYIRRRRLNGELLTQKDKIDADLDVYL